MIKYSETAFSNSNVNYFWSITNLSEVIERLRLRNFRGSQVSSFDFSTLYISLPHGLITANVLSLVNWCFNRESKTYVCISVKAGFLATRNDSYKCWSCSELCEAFTFLMENIYVQFHGMVYQQIVGIRMGTNCAPLLADSFLYCYERDFMSDFHKSKCYDLIQYLAIEKYAMSWRFSMLVSFSLLKMVTTRHNVAYWYNFGYIRVVLLFGYIWNSENSASELFLELFSGIQRWHRKAAIWQLRKNKLLLKWVKMAWAPEKLENLWK